MIDDILYYKFRDKRGTKYIDILTYSAKEYKCFTLKDETFLEVPKIDYTISSPIYIYEQQIIFTAKFNKSDFKTIFLDSETGVFIKELDSSIKTMYCDGTLNLCYIKDKVGYVDLYNMKTKLSLTFKRSEFWDKMITSNNIYTTNKNQENKIFKYNRQNGKKLWEIVNTNQFNTLNDNPSFVTAIDGWVINNKVLFVPLRNGKILVIDDEKGEVLKVLFSPHPNGQWGEYYHDTSRNKLVKFINKTIHEVDLDTHEIAFFEPARFKDKDAEPNGGKWAQDETYIYYCSLDGTTVNALNKETKEIDWQHQHNQNAADLNIVKEVPVRYRSVQYHEGRLFVMDNKRNLHIFEEEDMPTKVTS